MRARSGSLPGWAVAAAVAWLGAVGAVDGHAPPGAWVGAFQFPDDLVPVIDGDLDDWAVAGPGLTDQDFQDLVAGAPVDADDLSLRVWIGWNDTQNRLFLAAEVRDDVHQVDRPAGTASARIFLDDALEVFIDADHSGGQFADFSDLAPEEQLLRNGADASHFVLAGPHSDGEFFVNFSAAAWYALEDGPYTRAAVAHEGPAGGSGRTRYELALEPFDRVNMTADFLSAGHDLAEGQTVGLNLEFDDFDALPDLYDAKWSLSGGYNAYRLSERFADLLLLPLEERFRPTAVASVTWGRIKASLRP